jgi:hypothetical protein
MRQLTDAEISAAIDRNPEIYALWLKAIEIAKRPAPLPKPKKTLVELTGKIADAVAANPDGVGVYVKQGNVRTFAEPGSVRVLPDGWQDRRVLDAPIASASGRPEYPNYFRDQKAGGAVSVYNPIDRLKD